MIDASQVHETLRRYMLVDGFDIVLDFERSHGAWVRDARTGDEYLDGFTFFASWPVGYNHPGLSDPAFTAELTRAAKTKVVNSDMYTPEMAAFVDAFCGRVTPPGYPHHFWVSGGALAVENAMKAAFDWKARKLGRIAFDEDVNDLVILHFNQAFHGRSGYTLSVTNTLPDKIGLFPKFDWPRVHNPAIEFGPDGEIANDVEAEERRACEEIEAAFKKHANRVAAILIEPIQGEGGDNHFRPEFLHKLREYADEREALLIFDEVQTGFFGTGPAWAWQNYGVSPDVVSFGKKTQVCGIYASSRIDEVENNVFRMSSRINSTWGGNLVDMVRCRRFIEIVESEKLAQNVVAQGERLVAGLRTIAKSNPGISNARGLGSFAAFTLESGEHRNAMLATMRERRLLGLPTGPTSIRFRLPFVITADEVDTLLERVEASVPQTA